MLLRNLATEETPVLAQDWARSRDGLKPQMRNAQAQFIIFLVPDNIYDAPLLPLHMRMLCIFHLV